MASNQRIPVSEETRDAIRQLKPPGQTYDEFLQEFIEQKRREQLATDVKSVLDTETDTETTPTVETDGTIHCADSVSPTSHRSVDHEPAPRG